MNFQLDISLNTIFLSAVVVFVGWSLKAVAWALIESIKALITKLVETIARVEVLDEKMTQLTQAVGDVQKIRTDLNGLYSRLKKVEEKFKSGH